MNRFPIIFVCLLLLTNSAHAYVCNVQNQTIYMDLKQRQVKGLLACYLEARSIENNDVTFAAYQQSVKQAEVSCEKDLSASPKLIKTVKCYELEHFIKTSVDNDDAQLKKEQLGCL